MDRSEFDGKILNPIADKPQLVGLAQFHLDNFHAAIAGLATLGHRISYDFAPAPAPIEWPKMLYTGEGVQHHETMLVNTTEEQEHAIAEGWRLTPRPSHLHHEV